MKKLSLFLLLSLFAFYGCGDDDFTDTKDGIDNEGSQEGGDENDGKTYVLDLATYDAETLYLGDIENPDETWEDSYKNKYIKNVLTDKNNIFEFDCISVAYAPSTTFDFSSDSFAFTNNTKGNYSAVTKKGVNNDTYVVAGASGYTEVAIRFKEKNNTNKDETTYSVKGLYITNSLFAYGSMKDGDGYYGELEKFGPEDSLKLTIYNLDKTKKVDAYLAEGTNILTSWEWVDLTPLGETDGLKFELTTTKQNEYGPLTPSYFCLDGITLIEK